MQQQYYTVQQAAALLGISVSTVRRRIRDGTYPVYKYCARPLIPRKYILGNQVEEKRTQFKRKVG